MALQGVVTPTLTVSLAALEGFSDGPCSCSVLVHLDSSCGVANSPGGDRDPAEVIDFAASPCWNRREQTWTIFQPSVDALNALLLSACVTSHPKPRQPA